MIGSGGYFGNAGSVSERRQSEKTELRAEITIC